MLNPPEAKRILEAALLAVTTDQQVLTTPAMDRLLEPARVTHDLLSPFPEPRT